MDFGPLYHLELLTPFSYQDSDDNRLREGYYPAELEDVVKNNVEIEWVFRLLVRDQRNLMVYTDADLSVEGEGWEAAASLLGRFPEDEEINLSDLVGHSCILDIEEELWGDPKVEILDLNSALDHIQTKQQVERMLEKRNPFTITPEEAKQQNEDLNRKLKKTRSRSKSSKRLPLSQRLRF